MLGLPKAMEIMQGLKRVEAEKKNGLSHKEVARETSQSVIKPCLSQ